jgi:hypothetical protein
VTDVAVDEDVIDRTCPDQRKITPTT